MGLDSFEGAQQRDWHTRAHHRRDLDASGVIVSQVSHAEQKLENNGHRLEDRDAVFLNALQKRHWIDLIENHQCKSLIGHLVTYH